MATFVQEPKETQTVSTAHQDTVHDAQLNYYGTHLATCSSDRTVKIFDCAGDQNVHVATLSGHETPIWELSWSHPKHGVLLASCSFDGRVLIHRESPSNVWTLVHVFKGHESSVNSCSFAPHEHGLMVAAASSDGKISVLAHQQDDTWLPTTFQDNTLGVNAVAWAPYKSLGSTNEPRLVSGGCDNRIRFWRCDTTSGWVEDGRLGAGVGHSDWVRDVAWVRSTTPNNTLASRSEDKTVIIWTQSEVGGAWGGTLLNTFDAPVWRVSWSITGNILAVSSGDDNVTLWKAGLDRVWRIVHSVAE